MRISINNQYYYTDSEDFKTALNDFKIEGLTEYITHLESEADHTKQALNTDLESYEASLEDYNFLMNDTQEELNRLIKIIEESKKLNKQELTKDLKRLLDKIVSSY